MVFWCCLAAIAAATPPGSSVVELYAGCGVIGLALAAQVRGRCSVAGFLCNFACLLDASRLCWLVLVMAVVVSGGAGGVHGGQPRHCCCI